MGNGKETNVLSGLQFAALNRILVKTLPFLERVFCLLVVRFRVPFQHAGIVVETDGLAVCSDDTGWVGEEVVGVDDADVNFLIFGMANAIGQVGAVGSVNAIVHGSIVLGVGLPGDIRPNLANTTEVIEDTTHLIVAGFGRQKIVETGDFIEWRDRAAVIRRDAGSWVADQEGEVELLEDLRRDHGGIVGFSGC